MLDLYYAPTPNGWKITIMLEECGLPYRIKPINFARGDQYSDDYLAICPNGKMPALVDHDAEGGPLSVFESGAILLYLAEKTGRFLSSEKRQRMAALQWVFWQVANLGPMGGQVKHFKMFQPDNVYSLNRYRNEYDRLLGVLDYQLARTAFLGGGQYSIADMATVPWVLSYRTFGFDLATDFPHVRRWLDTLKQRPALRRGIDVGKEWRQLDVKPDEAVQARMLNQTSAVYRNRESATTGSSAPLAVDVFFDCSSPWTYMGFVGIRQLCARYGVTINWKPILVGGVFNKVNKGVYARREEGMQDEFRFRQYWRDLSNWAEYYGLDIRLPDFHPVNSVRAMRGALVAQDNGVLETYALGVFEAYWSKNQDISRDEVLGPIVDAAGFDRDDFFEAIETPAIKRRLIENGDELIERGGYGSPTLFLAGDEMFFGNDRLPLVEWAIRRHLAQAD